MTEYPLSGYNEQTWADHVLKYVIKLPCSRGDSGALYLQSATAGVMFCLGRLVVMQPFISDVDVLVLRNGTS